MSASLVVADENMPCAAHWFGALGPVRTLPGRSLSSADLKGAGALMVRSVTRVDAALLEGTQVVFVGTATIGTDHLDLDYLQERGIAYASAPGCNANSVAEYVLSALCVLDGVLECLQAGGRVGIIGLGNVGKQVLARLRALGIECCGYDPLLSQTQELPLTSLEAVLACDVVCCHAPLTRSGPHPSFHLLGAAQLRQLKPGAVLISAGRGAVVDNQALLALVRERPDLRTVLDVWAGEPAIDLELLAACTLGTPHIAGYSLEGRLEGTRRVLNAYCGFLGVPVPALAQLAATPARTLHLDSTLKGAALARAAMLSVYDLRGDAQRLRATLTDPANAGATFDQLRKSYPERRELGSVRIDNWADFDIEGQGLLRALGCSGEA